jgi:hypothetical protein
MKQNKYDDPAFFANYSQMARSIGRLDEAGEWPAFRALLPTLAGKTVLDLGCGFGWHCRYAREQRARWVVGVDLSEKMLARARASTNDAAISFVATYSTAWYRGAALSFRLNIRSSRRGLPKTGITARRGSAYIGRSISTRMKARVRHAFWSRRWSSITALSPPM